MNGSRVGGSVQGSAILRLFSASGVRARVHTAIRWNTAPIDEIATLLPVEGRVLDLGCGHGLLALRLAVTSDASIDAVDIDASKIGLLRRVCERSGLSDRIHAVAVQTEWSATPDTYDAVVMSDVLYRLGAERAARMIRMAAAALRPGGLLVVQDTDPGAGWRSQLSRLQEHVAVRVLRLTAGQTIEFLPPGSVSGWMTACGLAVEGPWETRRFHPQFILVGQRE